MVNFLAWVSRRKGDERGLHCNPPLLYCPYMRVIVSSNPTTHCTALPHAFLLSVGQRLSKVWPFWPTIRARSELEHTELRALLPRGNVVTLSRYHQATLECRIYRTPPCEREQGRDEDEGLHRRSDFSLSRRRCRNGHRCYTLRNAIECGRRFMTHTMCCSGTLTAAGTSRSLL